MDKNKSKMKRSNTYLDRKQKVLMNLEKVSNENSFESSEFSDGDSNFGGQLNLHHKATSVPLSLKIIPPEEDLKKIEKEEEEAASLIKKLVAPMKKIDVSETDMKKSNNNIFSNVVEIYNKIRVIELEDIKLEEKTDEDVQSDESINQDILSQFSKNRKIRIDKKSRNSIAMFLIENNFQRQDLIIENKVEEEKGHRRQASIGKQMTMDSQKSKGKTAGNLTPKKNERRLTLKACDNFDLFDCQECGDPQCISGSKCKKLINISESGKLLVLYCSIQILQENILDATNVIEKYGIKYKTDKF